jgi:hypothetical protein
MDLDEFAAEAKKLARTATVLRFTGTGEPVGYWHGVKPGAPCVSIRHQQQWLTVYLSDSAGHVILGRDPLRSSTKLFAEDVLSLPPVDAVFRLGSSGVESYLARQAWQRTWPFNDNFKDSVPHQYEALWRANCPMYAKGIVAVCGGWHFPWPDGDFADLINSQLVLCTFENAEPWIEVFFDGQSFSVKERIT